MGERMLTCCLNWLETDREVKEEEGVPPPPPLPPAPVCEADRLRGEEAAEDGVEAAPAPVGGLPLKRLCTKEESEERNCGRGVRHGVEVEREGAMARSGGIGTRR